MINRDNFFNTALFWHLPYGTRRRIYRIVHPHAHTLFNQKRTRMACGKVYSFMGFDQFQCIFVHIPRSAGVSVATSLFGNLGGGHLSIREYMLLFPENVYKQYYKYTFVRNPWDRLVSVFQFLKQGGFDANDSAWAETHISHINDFNDFAGEWLNAERMRMKIHLRPQTYFTHMNGTLQLNFVGRFESLDHDFDAVARRLGISPRTCAVK